jgi:beta-glucosidase
MVATGVIHLDKDANVTLRLDYSMGMSVDPGIYGITLGMAIIPDLERERSMKVAQAADISVIFVNDEHTEGLDSNLALQLPGDQDDLIFQIARHSQRTVVVLSTNSAILMPWIDEVDAVVEMFYPGQQVGSAIARLLFGEVNFSGKLPVTFPKTFADTPTAAEERFPGVGLQANYSEGLFVGYRWFDEKKIEPLFPFGHGLSYTSFEIGAISVHISHMMQDSTVVNVSVMVQNTGHVYGQEVVQLYVQFPDKCAEPPRLLKGYKKTSLHPGETSTLNFVLSRAELSVWSTADGDWAFIPGEYVLFVGNSSRDLPLNKTITLS